MTRSKTPPRRTALECIEHDKRCLAAVFCSYTFDPLFFESHVLRTVLRLGSDPDEQTVDFLREGRAALQEVPVACFVDADARTPGQRLPYDLRLVHGRVFHPKLALILHEHYLELLLGSGNLTRGGYGDNTELWSTRTLPYADLETAAVVDELLGFLTGVERLGGLPSPQLAAIRELLRPRLAAASANAPNRSFKVLHSIDAPLLPAFLELIPLDAEIVRIGALAPFFERDDQQANDVLGMRSIFSEILAARRSQEAIIDLGFGWQGGPLGPPPVVPPLEQGIGRLWVLRHAGDPPSLEYLTPVKLTAKQVRHLDAHGVDRAWSRDQAEEALAERRLYPAAPLLANGPARIVEALRTQRTLQAWLLPTSRLDEGRPVRRPLHAKLLVITTRRRGKETTYVLSGSPNLSGRALTHPSPVGNVELAVVHVLEGAWTLPDLAPELIACPADQLELSDPIFPASGVNLGRWIADAVHDAASRELHVVWAPDIADAGPWRLSYLKRLIAEGHTPPRGELKVGEFDLSLTSCELTLEVAGETYSVPIRVLDLTRLPLDPVEASYGLAELIALLSRRIGRERLAHVVAQPRAAHGRTLLELLFGEGFTPTDIFRAWKNVAHELAEEGLSLPAFRYILGGPLGIRVVWQRMLEAVGKEMSREVVWFHGAELLKTLSAVVLPGDPDLPAKHAALQEWLTELRTTLERLAPDPTEQPWIEPILRFYRPLTTGDRHDAA
ncbi:MAG: hypothetical protein JNL82_00720 [Myxococcales bacterium]|nr:hypothetical protein [Myxococcales bacterium]